MGNQIVNCYFCNAGVRDPKTVSRIDQDRMKVDRQACVKCYKLFKQIVEIAPAFAKWDVIPDYIKDYEAS